MVGALAERLGFMPVLSWRVSLSHIWTVGSLSEQQLIILLVWSLQSSMEVEALN